MRHPEGFTDELFECFRASCHIWRTYVETTLTVWEYLPAFQIFASKPEYEFADPEISLLVRSFLGEKTKIRPKHAKWPRFCVFLPDNPKQDNLIVRNPVLQINLLQVAFSQKPCFLGKIAHFSTCDFV